MRCKLGDIAYVSRSGDEFERAAFGIPRTLVKLSPSDKPHLAGKMFWYFDKPIEFQLAPGVIATIRGALDEILTPISRPEDDVVETQERELVE
jgi:hypothetical protein